jgi:alkylation response protein AidB-like acyl-CoA dehydrogenase
LGTGEHTDWDLAHHWLAYAALREATRCADEDPDALPAAAAVARALASTAYFQTAADTIQLHGGIGYTWDYDAHLYYKNALSNKVLLGDPDAQLDRIAQALGM